MRDIVRLKLADALEMSFPELTPREVRLPDVGGKAHAVIGMRRAGKTYFLFQCLKERVEKGTSRDRLVYFNFEDERLAGLRADGLGLIIDEYYRQFPQYRRAKKVTFCFDEIQTIDGWEVFVRRILDEENVEVFVSGSSAKLLSREVATAMRGRAMETVITPFSFREFLRHHRIDVPEPDRLTSGTVRSRALKAFDDYVTTGGFPEAQSLDKRDLTALLQGYVDLVLFRDVVERHNVSNLPALRAFIRHVLRQPGVSLSVSKLYNDFRSQGIAVSKDTLGRFLSHLEDSFLLHVVELHARSERRRRVNPRKVYLADHALSAAFQPVDQRDRGHHLENIVACELFRRSRSVNYYRTRSGYEIDFLAQEHDGGQQLIQVSASVSAEATLKRESRALVQAGNQRRRASLLLLTEAEERTLEHPGERTIQVYPAWRWLCGL